MQIDWWTFLLQGINFLVLVWLLKRFLYQPVQEIVAKRKALARKAEADAEAAKAEAEAARQQYEAAQASFEADREALRKDMHQSLEAERAKKLQEAEKAARKIVESAKSSAAAERVAASGAIREAAVSLAADMAARMLASRDAAVLDALAFDHIEDALGALDADAIARLEGEFAGGGAATHVVSAQALKRADQTRWQKMIAGYFPSAGKAEFATDADLVAGVELRLPHLTIGFTAAGQLAQMTKVLTSHDRA